MKHNLYIILFLLFSIFCIRLTAQPTSGMVTYFKMDGNTNNFGSGTVTATANNTVYSTNAAGLANRAIQFQGATTSYVSITDNGNLDFTGDFTISFGVYVTSIATNQGFFDNGLNYGGIGVWYFASDHTVRFNFKNGSIGAAGALSANVWTAVCARRSGTTMSIFVNGTMVASGAEGTSAITYPFAPVLGQMFYDGAGGNYNPQTGKMDELRFYNRALSLAEIAQLNPLALPLKLGSLTAVKHSNNIQLNWETLSEQNTSHFDVERSTDGINFTTIGTVNSKGNSTTSQFYSFMDNQPAGGTSFYRLKMADNDGVFTYSRVIVVKNENGNPQITIFPNPVQDVLQVQLASQTRKTVNVSIKDISGKTIIAQSLVLSEGNNAISLPVSQLAKGTYFFTLTNETNIESKTFLKQ